MPQEPKATESTPTINLADSEPPPAPKSTRASAAPKGKLADAPKAAEAPKALPPPEAPTPAVKLMRSVLPLKPGSDTYVVIFKDVEKSFSLSEYSGALAMWMLWKLGCRDRDLMSREEPEDFIKYVPDAAGPRVWRGGKPPFQRFKLGTEPQPGDVLFLTNGPPETEMLAVFLGVTKKSEKGDDGVTSDPVWRLALVSQNGTTFAADAVDCGLKVRTMCGRALMGWLPLSALALTPAK